MRFPRLSSFSFSKLKTHDSKLGLLPFAHPGFAVAVNQIVDIKLHLFSLPICVQF